MLLRSSFLAVVSAFVFAAALPAQGAEVIVEVEAAEDEAVEYPVPKATGPFQEGDLMLPEGYYEKFEDGTAVNVRIIENRFRLYFLDADGLVMKPPFAAANIRLINSVPGNRFYPLLPLEGEAGMGSALVRRPPHNFQMVVTLSRDEDFEDTVATTFRYTREGAMEPDWELPEGAPTAEE